MSWDIADLPWLPVPPADFRERCRELSKQTGPAGAAAAALSRYALGANDLFSLGQAMARLVRAGGTLEPLAPLKLAVLGNGTTKLWAPTLPATAARHGVALDLVLGEYDQALQEAVDPGSEINRAQPDAVLLALDHRGLPWRNVPAGDAGAAEACLAEMRQYLSAIREGLGSAGSAAVVWQTLAVPPEPLLGQIDRMVAGAPRWMISRLNEWIVEECSRRGDPLLDVAALAEQAGTSAWFDPVQWNLHKLPFSQKFVPLYADHVCRILGALRGRARKCLVLDLDNTLWGGVIGDDGLEGIRVGQGTGEGEAFVEVQRYALALRDRGVILAIASKNEEENARLPFREHPDMLLKEAHIASFFANWTDKSTNLQAIARALNIGLDALVLLDDNPAERARVRAALPDVAVPELPADPSYYIRSLSAAGYFESIGFVAEDAQRAQQYAKNLERASLQAESRSLEEFLQSLEMVARVSPFDALGRARIAQLVNKSNQFNLTTRRYTEAEVAVMERDPELFTLQVRLSDRYGDNGMICCVVCRPEGEDWLIDTWLMSCRVLGRRVEELVLDEIVKAARARGVRTLHGVYVPTAKNGMVREHYAKLGFRPVPGEGEETHWLLTIDDYRSPDLPMQVERPDHDQPRHPAKQAARV